MRTRLARKRQEACLGQAILGCTAAPTVQHPHTLEEAKSLFADAFAVSPTTAGHDVFRTLPTSYLVHHVRESLNIRKGVLSEPENASAEQLHHPNNPRIGDIEEDVARSESRDVSWILARAQEYSRKRKMQQARSSLDYSSFELEMLSSKDIQHILVEGARLGEFGQAEEKSCTTPDKNLEAGGSTVEAAGLQAAATNGEMNIPLTPEIVHNHRGRSSSADHTSSSPEPSTEQGVNPSPERETQQGEPLRTDETCTNPPPSEQPMSKTKDGADIVEKPQKEQVTPEEVQENSNAKEKTITKRKRRYMPKIRAEKPRASSAKKPRNSTGKESATVDAIPPIAEIPEVLASPNLLQMKSFARIHQRYPKRRKRSRKSAAAICKDFPGAENPQPAGCKQYGPPVVQDPAYSDDFSRFLQESLVVDHSIKLCETTPLPTQTLSPADLGSSSHGSLFNFLSNWVGLPMSNQGSSSIVAQVHIDGNLRTPCPSSPLFAEEIVDHSSVEDPPSTPRRAPTADPFLSTCRDFTLVMPPSSPPSPQAVSSDAADLWDSFELESHVSTPAVSVRRTLNFDSSVEPWLQKCHLNQLHQVNINIPVVEQAVENPSENSREKELQIVAYDDGSKKMVLYKKSPGGRRIKYKPKVNLDSSTVRMFKTLTVKGMAEYEATAEQDKDSWEQARHQWQHRAHHFISIMREVQGSRAFSRWKGSVVDSVGGAFLTQNVSDFLSSNAFISLRARFPARKTDAKGAAETISTSPAKDQAAPVAKESATILRHKRPTIVELKKQQMEDDQRKEEVSERVATLLNSSNENENDTCVEKSLTDIVEILTTGLNECHVEPKDASDQEMTRPATILNRLETDRLTQPMVATFWKKGGLVVIKQWKESKKDVQAPEKSTSECTLHLGAMEVKATVVSFEELHPNPLTDIAREELVLPRNHSEPNLSSESVEDEPLNQAKNSVELQDCVKDLPGVGEMLPVHEEPIGEDELDPHGFASSWKGKLASTVIQEKFASVVTESVTSLTEVGREKVLAATLRQVLGKKFTTREIGVGKASSKALKNFKLRPARAALRRSSDNYRYRHNVSFRLLSGEARANWEAGFVMKCQKAKWEPLRAAVMADESYCRDPLTEDSVDWSAVQKASVHEVADVIKNRGQHNALAGRMKAFLDRVHRDQDGSIDLEWIRKLPPEDAKAFLLSFRGVGLKSVECIRLLTLHHPSFPVDTNVGRILVRLGWVPLEPLPEETQLHLLELYPIQSQIQQYIWPRMCTLDQKTLYELHYQMITFGKVFCTKSKPNCNACPLRRECKHYASSYASAKLLLKGPQKQEKQSRMLALQGSTSTDQFAETEPTHHTTLIQGPCIPIIEEPCIPIIEVPQSPEPNPDSIPDIEELPFHVEFNTLRAGHVETNFGNSSSRFSEIIGELCSSVDVKRTLLDLNSEPEPDTFVLPPADTEMLKPQVLEMNMNKVPTLGNSIEVTLERTQVTVDDGVEESASLGVTDEFINHLPSQELILLPPQASLAPAPKLKNVQRLRTVHFVYELPDNHPLLFEMDKREADDPCFYLLAIWSPDEVPATMPKINDDDASNPFASCQDNDPEKTVRGTLLIPCKTAMRGYFPLNGTYFQVNEVFADHASSVQPIDVPRTLLWSLRRRFVYFSTAVSNLFKDMSQEEIQCCFQKGYVCLRAFDVVARQPKILAPRLHQSGAKIVKAPAPRKGRGGRGWNTPAKDKPQAKTIQKSTSEAPLMETTDTPAMIHEGL